MNSKRMLSNNLYMISYLWKYCPAYIVLSCISAIASVADILINVLFVRALINSLIRHEPFGDIIQLTMLVIGIMIVTYVFNLFFRDYYSPYIMNYIHKKVQGELIQKASEVDLESYDNPEFYNRYVWLMNDADFRALETLRTMTECIRHVLSITFVFSIIIFIDPLLLLFSVIPLFLSLIINTRMSKIRYQMDEQKMPYERKRDYVKRVFYLQQYAKEVRLTHIGQVLRSQFNTSVDAVIHIVKNHTGKLTLLDICSALSQMIIGTIASMLYLSFQVFRGRLSIGDFSALLTATGQINQSLQGVFTAFSGMYQNSLYIENFRIFMDFTPVPRFSGQEEVPLEFLPTTDSITFRQVTFTYPGQHTPTLNSIDIAIGKGENVAIVGHNGAGKSTLVKLLLGLYKPQQGQILLHGTDAGAYEKSSYMSHFGSVLQDFQIYATSVAENVLMREIADAGKDERQIWQALEKVGMKERIERLPHGIYTDCSREFNEEGVEFSGGERQRLALARIFIEACDIVILDEPSSSLDPIAEHEIYKMIMDNCADKTVIIISHRLSSTMQADQIYLLEEGEVLEEGTHEELMRLRGEYHRMFSIQAEKYAQSI